MCGSLSMEEGSSGISYVIILVSSLLLNISVKLSLPKDSKDTYTILCISPIRYCVSFHYLQMQGKEQKILCRLSIIA